MDALQELKKEIQKINQKTNQGILIVIGSKNFRHGTGRSLVAKTLAEKLGTEHFSTGDEFRKKAKKKNMTINEYAKYVEKHPRIDQEFDRQNQEKIKEKLQNKKNIVADSNLLAHFMKADVSIAIDTDDEIRAKRVQQKHREGDAKYANTQEALKELKERDKTDKERYERIYGVNTEKLNHQYDIQVKNNGPIKKTIQEILERTYKKVKTK